MAGFEPRRQRTCTSITVAAAILLTMSCLPGPGARRSLAPRRGRGRRIVSGQRCGHLGVAGRVQMV
jgi:hypothetical protein